MNKKSEQYNTKWAKEPPPYGVFKDYVIFETSTNSSFVMHEFEFDWIAKKIYDLYFFGKKTKYIQILKEWNETAGFYIEEKPSVIKDLSDTIHALSCIKFRANEKYGEPTKEDLDYLIKFLKENRTSIISIRKE
ncbi:MAG: hypothetical protein GY760_00015 [Deltaproteobacteria bacterium]|nr:hypothetical protein [Deltaproteobacteria bacterium]